MQKISLNSEESKQERKTLKNEFEKIFNKNNWAEAMSDEECIREYTQQYRIFLDTYSLFEKRTFSI